MKLRNKLILSCAALAAVATTAVSTTYAWYTSNREVKAGTVTAATKSNGEDLLLISRTGVEGTWSSEADLNDISVSLVPVYKDAAGNFHAWNDQADAFSTANATGGFVSFDLYFKSGNATNLNVRFKNFNLQNLTRSGESVLPTKSALNTAGLGNVTGGQYSVDIFRALTMEITESKAVEAVTGGTVAIANATDANAITTYYAFESGADGDTFAANGYTAPAGGVNAHTYYNAVKGLTKTQTTYTYTAVATADLNEDDLDTYYEDFNGTKVKTADTTIDTAKTYYTRTSSVATVNKGILTAADGSVSYRTSTWTAAEEYASGTQYYTRSGEADNYVYTLADITEFAEGVDYYTFTTAGTDNRTDVYATPQSGSALVNKANGNTSGWNFTNSTGSGSKDDALVYTTGETANTTGVSVLKVHFDIYLDGWDKACFDAVQGQTITLDMVFETLSQ